MDVVLAAIGRFLVSPGFAGFMAIGAATIAYYGVAKRMAVDAAEANATRRHEADLAATAQENALAAARIAGDAALERLKLEAENARWWQIVDWLTHGALSGFEVQWMEVLTESSTTDLQDRAIIALIDMTEEVPL